MTCQPRVSKYSSWFKLENVLFSIHAFASHLKSMFSFLFVSPLLLLFLFNTSCAIYTFFFTSIGAPILLMNFSFYSDYSVIAHSAREWDHNQKFANPNQDFLIFSSWKLTEWTSRETDQFLAVNQSTSVRVVPIHSHTPSALVPSLLMGEFSLKHPQEVHPQTSSLLQHRVAYHTVEGRLHHLSKAVVMTYRGFEKGTRLDKGMSQHLLHRCLERSTAPHCYQSQVGSSNHRGSLCCFPTGFSTAGNPPALEINCMEDF